MPKDYRPDTLHRTMDTVDKLRDIHGRKVTAKDHHAYEAASKESRPATAAFESDISNLIRDATDWQEFTKRQGERGSHERWYTTPLHLAIRKAIRESSPTTSAKDLLPYFDPPQTICGPEDGLRSWRFEWDPANDLLVITQNDYVDGFALDDGNQDLSRQISMRARTFCNHVTKVKKTLV